MKEPVKLTDDVRQRKQKNQGNINNQTPVSANETKEI